VGSPAINPVPLAMIRTAVREAALDAKLTPSVVVRVNVPRGEELARKTMNPRLGILGGISILGTTGIVEPLSLSAYTHSISCGIDVALAGGLKEVVLSTGRSSERAVEAHLELPPPAFILTGDHMGFALEDAGKREGLRRVTIAGQFGKFSKLAAGHFETHFTKSSVELGFIAEVCRKEGVGKKTVKRVLEANTAREVFFILKDEKKAISLEQEGRVQKTENTNERLIQEYETRLQTEPANLKLVAFAAHPFNQNCNMQFSPSGHRPPRGFRFDPKCHVSFQFFQ